MIKKHGSEAAVRKFMSASGKTVIHRQNGGFAALKKSNPEQLHTISKNAAKKRWEKYAEQKDTES